MMFLERCKTMTVSTKGRYKKNTKQKRESVASSRRSREQRKDLVRLSDALQRDDPAEGHADKDNVRLPLRPAHGAEASRATGVGLVAEGCGERRE